MPTDFARTSDGPITRLYSIDTEERDRPCAVQCPQCRDVSLVLRSLLFQRDGKAVMVCPPPEPRLLCPACGWECGGGR